MLIAAIYSYTSVTCTEALQEIPWCSNIVFYDQLTLSLKPNYLSSKTLLIKVNQG